MFTVIACGRHVIRKVVQTVVRTRSTGTVHTSAKARFTSVAISVPPSGESVRDLGPLPLSVSPNSDKSRKHSLYTDGDSDRHQHLIAYSLAHCQPFLKISCKSVWKLVRKIANRQTKKQRQKHNLLPGGKETYHVTRINNMHDVRLTIFSQNCARSCSFLSSYTNTTI